MIFWYWLACRKDVAPEVALPEHPMWFDVGPGESLCLSAVPTAGPLPQADRERLSAVFAAFRAGNTADATAQLQSAGEHPAIAHARAIHSLLEGDESVLDALIGLAATHPDDVCLAVTGALASAGKGDLGQSAADVQRARKLAPTEPNVALLSWFMQLEDPELLAPLLVDVADTNPSAAYAVGLERFAKGEVSCIELLQSAAEGGLPDALGPLLFAYRRFHRTSDYLKLASELELLHDGGRIARSTDPVAEYKAALSLPDNGTLTATFRTSMGDFSCRLLHDVAPVTVANFVGLAQGSFPWTDPRDNQLKSMPLYDGTIFHRVIPEFMIQGGDLLGTGTGDAGYRFHDEIDEAVRFDKGGLLAMANAGPNTNGSQFFITELPLPHLDGRYTIFGDCGEQTAALVAKMARVPTGEGDKPSEPITLQRVEITAQAP